MADKQPERKDYGLTQEELLTISEYNKIANSIMGVFLSHLVISRFGYQVTQNTRFEVRDGRLFVSEENPEQEQQNETKLETA